MFWELIGLSAAVLTSFAFIPQVAKMYSKKSAKDISLITLFQLSLGVGLWIIYGIHLKNIIIIAANAFTFFTLLCAIGLYHKYKAG